MKLYLQQAVKTLHVWRLIGHNCLCYVMITNAHMCCLGSLHAATDRHQISRCESKGPAARRHERQTCTCANSWFAAVSALFY